MAPRRARAQHVSEQTQSPCGGTADPARNRAGGARAACACACAARRRSVGRARTSSTLESTHSTSEPSMSMSSAARCGRSRRPLGPARAASARRDGACAASAGVRRAGRAGTHAGANAIACDTHAAIASTRCITAMSGSTSVFPRTRGRTRGEKRTKFYCGKLRSARHWLSSGSVDRRPPWRRTQECGARTAATAAESAAAWHATRPPLSIPAAGAALRVR